LSLFIKLAEADRLDLFTKVRADFEQFLLRHKEAFYLLVKGQGAGHRSRPAIEEFMQAALDGLSKGLNDEEIVTDLAKDSRFRFLATPPPVRESSSSERRFGAGAKSAAFISSLEQSGVRCGVCGALLHRNSMSADHVVRRQDGGSGRSENAQLTHPYCNSGYKERAVSRARAAKSTTMESASSNGGRGQGA
jgi:hypothetical protein